MLDRPLSERRRHLEEFINAASSDILDLTIRTSDRAEAECWLNEPNDGRTDGVVAKRIAEPYTPGECMPKVKRLRTAGCVGGGFRYESKRRLVGLLLLGRYDDAGLLHHVGFTSAIAKSERARLAKKLEARRKPSRWSTERTGDWEPVRPDLVVEVRYDHITDMRYHGHYTDATLRTWARAIRKWRRQKRDVYCFFDNDQKSAAPRDG